MKNLLLSFFVTFSITTSFATQPMIEPGDDTIFIPMEYAPIRGEEKIGDFIFQYSEGVYHIITDEDHIVENAFIDPILRNISEEDLAEFFDADGYIQVKQFSDGEFALHAKSRLRGGGFGGWLLGAVTGKFIVHAIGGGIAAAAGIGVGIIAGPIAGAAVAKGTWAVIAPTVEAISTTVALAGGITVGSITGPI